ncbi:MAG: efflux RND transporter periplasmic adaptor subunit [Pseudomonadales bacterium]|nr:efflux RND transporter periplasmic adaptor subunit [Pseudomonadales bacterium]
MNLIKRHPLLTIFVVVIAVIGGVTANTYIKSSARAGGGGWDSGPTTVVTARAEIKTIIDKIESIGTAAANESVLLTPKVTETVRKVNFDDGMYVERGDILVELTNAEETAQLSEAQATSEEATRQFNRVRNLIDQKLASETQLDTERVRMQTANARLEAIVARLDDRLIRAPFSGVLGFRKVSQGTLLTPTTPVTTLDDVSIIKLDFDIPENHLRKIKPGQEVIAKSVAYPDTEFVGSVNTIDSRVDPVTRTVRVRAHINNDKALLRPGMLLTVDLILERDNALVVPESAIIPIQDRHYVYTVSDKGTAEQVAVEVGRRQPGIVEIIKGISAGQEVITQGVIKIRPGSPVQVRGG